MNDWLEAAKEIAVAAGDMVKEMAASRPKVTHKGPVDLVTEADVRAEKYIIGELLRRFPGHQILAEESGGTADAEYVWIIDPIDGTTNYAHGFPVWAVSIGLFIDKRPAVGVVYDPNLGELFAAVKGSGAVLNDKPISVSTVGKMTDGLLATGFPYTLREGPQRIMSDFSQIYLACQGVRRAGAATIDLCAVACGRFDGFWEVGLKPWDTAAAGLIVEEAGGRLSKYSGGSFDHFVPEMVASNGLIHQELLDILQRQD
ncbi:MAG: inositol monophosphatase family protein [Actinomycetota bacterium]|nr:inositol monophosphatase family protein [Actinomycetota bacterium]